MQNEFLMNADSQYFETMYEQFRRDKNSMDKAWRAFFEGFELALSRNDFPQAAKESAAAARKELHVLNLINGYRARGHFFTRTNPVRMRRKYEPDLNIQNFNLVDEDLSTVFQAGVEIGIGPATLRDIISHAEETYCKSFGAEYMFIRYPERVKWLQQRMESIRNQPVFSISRKRRILYMLNHAVVFENFLHSRFAGQKRFSLEGGETLIPGLDALIEKGAELGISEFLIGMPHRGRLNVLANILNKEYEEIFSEFEGQEHADAVFSGDVKYHLGFSSEVQTEQGTIVQLGLAPNPSHLEAVNPVVEGMARSKIDHKYNGDTGKILPILIHGDAALAAQGVVYEVIQMSGLQGYGAGGTIHLVINNQLGFTTNYLDGRSSVYCTDIGKVTHSPIFHVNADDAEAVVHAVQLAAEYRQQFHTDVFIDLLGYRRYGHNEGDEPRFTQPRLYKAIAAHPDPRKIYNERLLSGGEVEKGLAEEMEKEYRALLQEKLGLVKQKKVKIRSRTYVDPCDLKKRDASHSFEPRPVTAVGKNTLKFLAGKIFSIPDEFSPISKMHKIYEDRRQRFNEGRALDWASAELLAYASLLNEKNSVRLSGQDSERGTFAHRHAVVLSEDDESSYIPLQHISEQQGQFSIYNSLLSEYGALGFEYGYACANPNGLTIWEAQFGDFSNGAQIIIDQFIASAEVKWNRSSGVTLFLPHGFEGQGPEHSSARIERFLSLCANENMRVANCTTPANFFHLLRSQMKYPFRLPLVVFTPKSLLRHPACVSGLDEFTDGSFQEIIDDAESDKQAVRRIVFCSGKIYYDLLEYKLKESRRDVALLRLEQLYPFPAQLFKGTLDAYPRAESVYWVQEEPANAGAYGFLKQLSIETRLNYISRKANATTATGFHKQHHTEQEELLRKAFDLSLKGDFAV
jgi:2-oxoglutarate dehydrogenase E1 component